MMNLASIEWEDIELLHDIRRAGGGAEPLRGFINVGRPIVIDAIEFYRASQQSDPLMGMLGGESDFYYVRLPISFRPVEGVQLSLVSVELDLKSADNEAEAWSMQPQKVEQEIKVGLQAKIDSGLKLSPVELSSSMGSSEEYIVYQPEIEAYNIGRRDPAWEFRPTTGRRLSGIQLLHLVIRQPKQTASQCKVSIKGDAEDKRGFFNFFGRTRKAGGKLTFACPSERSLI